MEHEIFIHNIRDMELLHKIEDTPSNRNGVIAFTSHPEHCLLAYPGSNRVGTVFIFDAQIYKVNVTLAWYNRVLILVSTCVYAFVLSKVM